MAGTYNHAKITVSFNSGNVKFVFTPIKSYYISDKEVDIICRSVIYHLQKIKNNKIESEAYIPYYVSDGHTNQFRANMLFPFVGFSWDKGTNYVLADQNELSYGGLIKYTICVNITTRYIQEWIINELKKKYPDDILIIDLILAMPHGISSVLRRIQNLIDYLIAITTHDIKTVKDSKFFRPVFNDSDKKYDTTYYEPTPDKYETLHGQEYIEIMNEFRSLIAVALKNQINYLTELNLMEVQYIELKEIKFTRGEFNNLYADLNDVDFETNVNSYLKISKNLQKYMKTKIIEAYKKSPVPPDKIDFYNKFNILLLPITEVIYNTPKLKDKIISIWKIKTGKNNNPGDNNVYEYIKSIVNSYMTHLISVAQQLNNDDEKDKEYEKKEYLKLTKNIKKLINHKLMFDRETMILINELNKFDNKNIKNYIYESYIFDEQYIKLINKVIIINNSITILTLLRENKINNDKIQALTEIQKEKDYIKYLNQKMIPALETFTKKIEFIDGEYKQQREQLKQQYIEKGIIPEGVQEIIPDDVQESIPEDVLESVQEGVQDGIQEDIQGYDQYKMQDDKIINKQPSSRKKRKIGETDKGIQGGGKNKKLYKILLNYKLINLC
uniref:Uncharacterized protein n=1 Tax=viral metagenome TaxID=1070528 RepID=A0A6C0E0A0_9ZZZZ